MPVFNLGQLYCSHTTDTETGCSTCNGPNDPGYQACRQSFFLRQQTAVLRNNQVTSTKEVVATTPDASTTKEIADLRSSVQQLQLEYQQLESRAQYPLLEQSLII